MDSLVLDLIAKLDEMTADLSDDVDAEAIDPVQICTILITIGELAKLACSLIKAVNVKED